MPAFQPTPDQYEAFTSDNHKGPVSQVNLLKFHDHAKYQKDDPEFGDTCSGREAYFRYSDAFAKLALELGCKNTLTATTERYFIGEGDWDCVLVNTFPNKEAFLAMIHHPKYTEIARHRTAGLLCQELIVTRPLWLHGEQLDG